MEKERIKQIAKEFLQSQGIDAPGQFEIDQHALFLQSMIEKGVFVEADRYTGLANELLKLPYINSNEYAKHVNSLCQKYMDSIADISIDTDRDFKVGYYTCLNQFKATPAKEISDQEIEDKYPYYGSGRFDSHTHEGAKEANRIVDLKRDAAKWMREQLSQK
jgi:hypothetical protein